MGPGALGTARLQCALRQKWVSNPMEGNSGHSLLMSPPLDLPVPLVTRSAFKRCLFGLCLFGGFLFLQSVT